MIPVQVQWTAREYQAKKHGPNWFWTVVAIAVAIALGSIIAGNTLLAILVVIAATALLLQAVKKPQRITFSINEDGVSIGKILYLYEDLDSFGITDKHLLLKSKKRLAPFITIPLTSEHRESAHALLETYLPEERHTEPFADTIMEHLGF